MKFIPDWRNKNLRCHFCGETRSVKYTMEILDPVVDNKPTKVCVCNQCALRYNTEPAKSDLARLHMKKYFVDDFMTYCYPYGVSRVTQNYGVLSDYIGKYFNRDEIDKIICELITRHPYVENAMRLKLSVQWTDGNATGYYHILDFYNDNFEQQNRGNLEIKYEK